jgi:hypothetical protein
MLDFNTRIWLYGTLVEINVEYDVNDGCIEIESANVLGVYHKGDNADKRDYTPLGTDLPLDPSEMSDGLYNTLVFKAQDDMEERRWEYYLEG